MFTLNWGPCRRRSSAVEQIDRPDTPEDVLHRAYDFFGFLNGGLGGNRVVLHFLREVSKLWDPHRAVTFLELRCGRGDLSAAIVRWARRRKFEVRILAVDECPQVVQLARECHGGTPEINFDVRFSSDPLFLEAQQFDYVISSSALHSLPTAEAVKLLKTANMLAKRGLIFCDWLRDIRAWVWMQALARFWGDETIIHDALLTVRKGFTIKEVNAMGLEAGLDYAQVRNHLGYRFSLAGERGLVLAPHVAPVAHLAGA